MVKQTFNLIGSISKTQKASMKERMAYEKQMKLLDKGKGRSFEEQKEYRAKMDELEEKKIKAQKQMVKSVGLTAVSTVKFAYNYYIAVARFGQRGQDIQDQNVIQDRMFNKALGVVAATIANPVLGGVAAASVIFDEIIRTSIQEKAYQYKLKIDQEQKSISRERIGRPEYNSSRR